MTEKLDEEWTEFAEESKKLGEEWTEFAEESKKFKETVETFFEEKAPKKKPEEPETEAKDIAEIAEVREKREEEILKYPNVVGVATGYKIKAGKVTPELCIQVLVEEKIEEKLLAKVVPKDVEGIKTDVIATGRIEALNLDGTYRPAIPGGSIGHFAITAGTFGCLVQDKKEHDFLILSNNHVLANCNNASVGDPILQPGPFDEGIYPMDEIAKLEKFVPLTSGYNLVDAAVAKPLEQRLVIASIPWIGIPRGTAQASFGWVQKTGRTTQHTFGWILSIDATVMVGYGGGTTYLFKNQILTTNMAAGGDSGSLLVDFGGRAVGLLFAGSWAITVHNHISNVLMALDIEMVEA